MIGALLAEQMVDQRLLERPRPGQRLARAQSHRLAVLLSVEAERKGRRGEAVQRGAGKHWGSRAATRAGHNAGRRAR